MLKVNPVRNEYMAHIEKQKISGLSIKKYCEENNLETHKLSYYRSYKINTKNKVPKKAFAKIKITPSTPKKIVLKDNIDPVWLAKFLNQLVVKK